ncbi:MAG: energy-coupling factor transporter ATPase [Oscillospiraceae bacterium]|jgi:energy-coupling factor transport system ATP-binding protein|nr:energy-coupling factor transporter ATPase [Oscillospiraceae bacterium]
MSELVEARDLEYTYAGTGESALRGVTLTVREGTFVAILGRNGSGKSTFAKQLNVLITPSGGSARVMGMDTRDPANTMAIRQAVGLVFQNPDNQIVATVVEEDVAFGPENLGVPQPELRARVDGALDAVNMREYARKAPHMLSGGQKQRVAIAGALAMRPKLLALDEATAMLDPDGRREVMDTVRALIRDHGMTVVWITHSMEEAIAADEVVVISDGEAIMRGTPREVFSQTEKLSGLGLAAPQAAKVAALLAESGALEARDVLTVEELADAVYDAYCRR